MSRFLGGLKNRGPVVLQDKKRKGGSNDISFSCSFLNIYSILTVSQVVPMSGVTLLQSDDSRVELQAAVRPGGFPFYPARATSIPPVPFPPLPRESAGSSLV